MLLDDRSLMGDCRAGSGEKTKEEDKDALECVSGKLKKQIKNNNSQLYKLGQAAKGGGGQRLELVSLEVPVKT